MVKTLTFDEMVQTPSGTSLRGYFHGTREEIEAVFGAPTFAEAGEGDKVTTEWYLLFEDGTIATIYDWKRYELGVPEWDERIEWHIGGHDERAVTLVGDALGKPVKASY